MRERLDRASRRRRLAIRAGDARRRPRGRLREDVRRRHASRSLDALESAADLEVVAGLGLQFTAIYAMRSARGSSTRARSSPGTCVDVTVKSHAQRRRSTRTRSTARRSRAEQVAASRPIADPLTLLMCSSICDGAAAAVLVADDHAAPGAPARGACAHPAVASGFTPHVDGGRAVDRDRVLRRARLRARRGSSPATSTSPRSTTRWPPPSSSTTSSSASARRARPARCSTAAPRAIGGRLPVNPSGGLCSRGHPVGATGLAQIAELVWQLRGEAGPRQVERRRLGLAQNSGGWLEGEPAPAVAIHVLERTEPWD